MNTAAKRAPSIKVITPSRPCRYNIAVTAIIKGISILIVDFATFNLVITAEIPKIISTFIILLPTTLPIVISALPLSAAAKLTAASGALVPIATMVKPITSWGMPKRVAILAAPSTNQSAPLPNIKKPATNKPNCKIMSIPNLPSI